MSLKYLFIALVRTLINLIDFLFKKNVNTLFFVPHTNCKADNIDLINYASDNTLSFLNYLIRRPNSGEFKIYLLVYNFSEERIKSYREYLDNIKFEGEIEFVDGSFDFLLTSGNFKKILGVYKKYLRSKYVFASTMSIGKILFKSNNQIFISLNYFTPFKDDYFSEFDGRESLPVDYSIVTSNIAGQILSISSNVSFDKFKVLGFSRNDNLLDERINKEKLHSLISNDLDNDIDFKKIILYTPTYRDYEDSTKNVERDVFGYSNIKIELDNILEDNSALLLVKLHPKQNVQAIRKQLPRRSVIYKPTFNYSLYDIMTHADVLITDYTSAYFDYLFLNKPVVFNFYDRKIYEEVRGFSFDPIDDFCAGDIVCDAESFCNSINNACSGKDNYKDARFRVNRIMNKYSDSDSSKRIYDFFMDLN